MAQLDYVRKIYEDGMHCAFTDMTKWKGHYYVCFRRAERHYSLPPGAIFVIRSADLVNWEVCGRLTTADGDRDPAIVADGDRLLVYWYTWYLETALIPVDSDDVPDYDQINYVNKENLREVKRPGWPFSRRLRAHVSFTTDGVTWRTPIPVYKEQHWLFHPHRFDDAFYCVDCVHGERSALLRSADGLEWEEVSKLPLNVDEGAIVRFDDGHLLCAIREESDGPQTYFLESDPPYTDWSQWSAPHKMHGPAVIRVGKRVIGAGRRDDPNDSSEHAYVTSVYEIDAASRRTRHLLDLPSGGDTSYCGLVAEDDKTLLVSYYSQHEYLADKGFRRNCKPSSIYLARVSL